MTVSFFVPSDAAKAAHLKFKSNWKAASAEKRLSAADAVALVLHRAWWAVETQALTQEDANGWIESRLNKAFAPVSNRVKIENGADPQFSKKAAVNGLSWQLTLRERAKQKGELDLPSSTQAQSGWDYNTASAAKSLLEAYKRYTPPAVATARKVSP